MINCHLEEIATSENPSPAVSFRAYARNPSSCGVWILRLRAFRPSLRMTGRFLQEIATRNDNKRPPLTRGLSAEQADWGREKLLLSLRLLLRKIHLPHQREALVRCKRLDKFKLSNRYCRGGNLPPAGD